MVTICVSVILVILETIAPHNSNVLELKVSTVQFVADVDFVRMKIFVFVILDTMELNAKIMIALMYPIWILVFALVLDNAALLTTAPVTPIFTEVIVPSLTVSTFKI